MNEAADKSMFKMMGVTGVVIMTMLFIAYRSISTVLLVLVMVGFEMGTARGLVALLGSNGLLGFSTFVVAMLSSLAIAAGTDYAIFLIGRYQEARQAGQDRETAYYSMFRGTFHIILGSGLDDRRSYFRSHLARLSYFKALGIPSALGLLVVVAGAMTAGPAVVAVASRFGLLDPKRAVKVHGWRRIGTATVALARSCSPPCGHGPRRHPHHAQHEDQLQRPLLHTRQPAIECGICGRGSATSAPPQ